MKMTGQIDMTSLHVLIPLFTNSYFHTFLLLLNSSQFENTVCCLAMCCELKMIFGICSVLSDLRSNQKLLCRFFKVSNGSNKHFFFFWNIEQDPKTARAETLHEKLPLTIFDSHQKCSQSRTTIFDTRIKGVGALLTLALTQL